MIHRKKFYHPSLSNTGLFIGLILIGVMISSIYVSNERIFYYWDSYTYQKMTIEQAVRFHESPYLALYALKQSIANDYNYLFTLPLLPFLLISGQINSRKIYILAITLIYMLPFALLMGTIAVRFIHVRPKWVFWSTALLTILTPLAWVPTLRGYPDTGGSLLIGLGILVYLYDTELEHGWQLLLIGFFIAAALLFRRHFAYGGLALLLSILLHTVYLLRCQLHQKFDQTAPWLFTRVFRVGLIGVSALVIVALLGWPFVEHVLSQDFTTLYASYARSPLDNIRFYASQYGWITLLLVGLGFLWGSKAKVLNSSATIFIVLFGAVSVLQWFLKVRQLGPHYTLHFTPVVILGLAAFLWSAGLKLQGPRRGLILFLILGYLILNFAISLSPLQLLGQLGRYSVFSAKYPPAVHQDYDQIIDLVNYLRTAAPNGEPILVAASSGTINHGLLQAADRTLPRTSPQMLNILNPPEVDSRDFYPIELLMQAQFVILASPFQHHLPPEEQQVVEVVYNMFTDHWEIAQDFTRLPLQPHFADGKVTINIYQRHQPTSFEVMARTLHVMQQQITPRPGSQPDWIRVTIPSPLRVMKSPDNGYHLSLDPDYDPNLPSQPAFLYLGPLSTQIEVAGSIKFDDKRCPGINMRLVAVSSQGRSMDVVDISRVPLEPDYFSLSFPKPQTAAFLRLDISLLDLSSPLELCRLDISNLTVSTGQ